MIKNPVKKVDVKIVTTWKQYFKWLLRPTLKTEKQFRTEAIAIEKGKCRNLNKPIYIGTSILSEEVTKGLFSVKLQSKTF